MQISQNLKGEIFEGHEDKTIRRYQCSDSVAVNIVYQMENGKTLFEAFIASVKTKE